MDYRQAFYLLVGVCVGTFLSIVIVFLTWKDK
jgi:hypothetical protein